MDAKVKQLRGLQDRSVSLPPPQRAPISTPDLVPITSSPSRPASTAVVRSNSGGPSGLQPPEALDSMTQLQRSSASVVKTRTGSVLSRGFVLKTDHYPSGRALELELNVHGAPNFRPLRQGNFNVYGTAQPRTEGLRAILSILGCRPSDSDKNCVWFSTREEPIVYISGRSFVLRDAAEPRRTLGLSDRAENLEGIEQRLKHDILQEAAKFGGLILTHNEIVSPAGNGEGPIVPTWTSVDAVNVKTSKELWEQMRKDGWKVEYYRIPVSPEHPIEDNYLDAYVNVIKNTDPSKTALVFSCGMGAVRTTFAMVAASLVRRKQRIARGFSDPFEPAVKAGERPSPSGTSTPTAPQVALVMEQVGVQQDLNKSLLRLTHLLQQALQEHQDTAYTGSAVELLLTQPVLLDSLRKAHMGNYGVILSLLGCLDHGLRSKKLVDRIVDACDQVVNLREDIISHRMRYSLTSMNDAKRESYLEKAVRSIEMYFFMIAFASYVDEQGNFEQTFSHWMKARTEIWNQVMFLRKSTGSRLNVFAPVNDLSAMSKTGSEGRSMHAGQKNDLAVSGGQILGDEYSEHVVKNRGGIILREGTLLKSDQWLSESSHVERAVRGAINFRRIPDTMVYALGQPTENAIDDVVELIKREHPNAERVLWITLREEPVVYVNGSPYCLRRERFSLRNMKDYGGISASRLEVLEDRLRDDVISEVNTFGGRLLLHTETPDGSVVPVWEDVKQEEVAVLKDIMAARVQENEGQVRFQYTRIPITAERPPDFSDLSELLEMIIRTDSSKTPIVLNDQLGRGRATLASIIVSLIQRWLRSGMVTTPSMGMIRSLSTRALDSGSRERSYHSYQVINNLLRVVRNGLLVKDIVDEAIDQCAAIENLRDSIEDARVRAEEAVEETKKRLFAQRGLQNLRRYFELIIFQWYLMSIEPDTRKSFDNFEEFVKNRPVINTFLKELFIHPMNALKPLERVNVDDKTAFPDEEKLVVANRSGSILSASTILKSDMFSNLQKLSLPERIDGAPNFRRIPLMLRLSPSGSPRVETAEGNETDKWVCGSGMPTVQGLRRALSRVDAHPEGSRSVFWTCLREEPVLYVAGRPHVLRLVDRPLVNVEATGVSTQTVETMENNLKRDVLREVRASGGRILLHDEVEERPGMFTILPMWENVGEEDIMTPRDVFELMVQEGFKINYDRVAITDEQAPLPDALAQILDRVEAGSKPDGAGDFIFNCQMGRGRTTTGMVTACLIATVASWDGADKEQSEEAYEGQYDAMDGPSEEEAYLQGEYKIILQLVGVLSHGKMAKRLTDRAIDAMQDVQNLRKAIYDYKLKCEASQKGSEKHRKLKDIGVNYLYRYGAMIVFANYLIEVREADERGRRRFPAWLQEHREITTLLSRRTLD